VGRPQEGASRLYPAAAVKPLFTFLAHDGAIRTGELVMGVSGTSPVSPAAFAHRPQMSSASRYGFHAGTDRTLARRRRPGPRQRSSPFEPSADVRTGRDVSA
jgi:hypothetical protein